MGKPRVVSEIPGYWALSEEDQRTIDELMRRAAKLRDRAKAKGEKVETGKLLAEALRSLQEGGPG